MKRQIQHWPSQSIFIILYMRYYWMWVLQRENCSSIMLIKQFVSFLSRCMNLTSTRMNPSTTHTQQRQTTVLFKTHLMIKSHWLIERWEEVEYSSLTGIFGSGFRYGNKHFQPWLESTDKSFRGVELLIYLCILPRRPVGGENVSEFKHGL